MVCLCGCGADNQHCNRPNRPPSPNNFFEDFWAPNFVDILQTRLENVLRNGEPSKRELWRSLYGGLPDDEKPFLGHLDRPFRSPETTDEIHSWQRFPLTDLDREQFLTAFSQAMFKIEGNGIVNENMPTLNSVDATDKPAVAPMESIPHVLPTTIKKDYFRTLHRRCRNLSTRRLLGKASLPRRKERPKERVKSAAIRRVEAMFEREQRQLVHNTELPYPSNQNESLMSVDTRL
ncbi:hypothetical protein MMC28_001316 [Mycoblastus sanguinarius]|nr:hypothetical protein [Mycoblastus sanguinarius]